MSSNNTVLNVNDQAAMRYVATRQLRAAGFDVIEAATGGEALEVAAMKRPSLVVLDVKLPDIDGLEVCRRLRDNPVTSSMAILHTSATFITHEMRVLGLDGGADGYLAQPFTAAELVATVRSLLRLKEAEREQRRRAEELIESDRRKDEFLAMLAHELRNPLAAISNATALLHETPLPPHLFNRVKEVLGRQIAQLNRLVEDLLDVSRMVRGTIALRREKVQLSGVVSQAVELARSSKMAPRDQVIDLKLDEGTWFVDGDAARIEQALMNILDNASKFSESGGTIQMRVKRERDGDKDWAVITVRDGGVGISAEKLSHLFEPFYQANPGIDRSRGGLGVGLALVRRVAELHGGVVSARSDGEGAGCEIVLRLPLISEAPAEQRPLESAASPPRTGRNILVVEDNDDARGLLTELLSRWGHRVHAAPDGLTALDITLKERPDLAFIDIGLPGIDGLEVARRIRRGHPSDNITLVALTGYGAPAQRDEALSAGFDMHLVKPASADRLRMIAGVAASPDKRDS